MTHITYIPSKTVLDFHNSRAQYKALAGPPGAGKTVGALWECIFRTMRQEPDQSGRRRTRVAVIRASYPNLETTTIKTVKDWMPAEWGTITMAKPPRGFWEWDMPDGSTCELEMYFMSIANADEVYKMRSLEISVAWLTEATEVTKDVFSMAVQRIGRFPSNKDGVVCTEPGIVMDFNLPGTDHWLHDICVKDKPENLEFFAQPPAVICTNFDKADAGEEPPQYVMNPEAENLHNLPDGYYENQLVAFRGEWGAIKSFLLMKWATFNTGKVVYTEFSRSAHVASVPTEPLQGLPVFVGIDTSGLNPGAVFGQVQAGSLVILDEIYGEDTAFQEFVEEGFIPRIAARYANMELLAICDPSNPRDALTGRTPIQTLASYGIKAIPAITNKFKPRREAVAHFLLKRSGMAIDAKCHMLIMALEEKYVYRKLRIASVDGVQYSSEPEKNNYSHVIDALQYLCLYITMPNSPVGEHGDIRDYRGVVKPRRLLR